jgi:hypothetical protein
MVSGMPYRDCDSSDAHLLPAVIPDGSIYFPQKLFVGGLSHPASSESDKTVSENDLAEFFGKFGKVTEVKFICHHEDGSFRGFAFVTFDSEPVVKKVMTLYKDVANKPLFHIKGVELKLGFAVRKGNGGAPAANGKRSALSAPTLYNQNAAAAIMFLQQAALQQASSFYSTGYGLPGSPYAPYSNYQTAEQNGGYGNPNILSLPNVTMANTDSNNGGVKPGSPTSLPNTFLPTAYHSPVSSASPVNMMNASNATGLPAAAAYNNFMYLNNLQNNLMHTNPLAYLNQSQHMYAPHEENGNRSGQLALASPLTGVGTTNDFRPAHVDRFGNNIPAVATAQQIGNFY